MSEVRLSKIMSHRGICSRREADHLISKGWVVVDGQVVDQLGFKALEDCEITLTPEAQNLLGKQLTIIINKPVGYVSSQPEKDYKAAVELITPGNRSSEDNKPRLKSSDLRGLAPAGRLDIDSKGLLVLTQDGVLAKRIIGADSKIDKEYLVRVSGTVSDDKLAKLRSGLSLDDRQLKPALIEVIDKDLLKFTLNEGRKRQIRRMCELVDLKVISLKRVRIGKLMLGRLKLGQWRVLDPGEVI